MQELIDEDLDQMQVMLTIREAKKLLETKKGPDSFIKPTPMAGPSSVDVLPVGDQVTLKKANDTDVEQQNGEIKEEQALEWTSEESTQILKKSKKFYDDFDKKTIFY